MTEIGKYELCGEIGHGGFAVVYRAKHKTLLTEAAVKILNAALAEDETVRERFVREAQTASQLEHPNIVKILGLGEEDGKVYIAMEYMSGGDLNAWRQQEPTPGLQEELRILSEIAASLDHAHAQGVIHRDVKPGNILMDVHGQAHLADFGLVLTPGAKSLTRLGNVVGTSTYLSPEQAEGKTLDGRSDQYALAVVAYEMIVGQPPFQGENSTSVALMHVTKAPPPPKEVNPEIPDEVAQVLLKALSKDPQKRYDTCSTFAQTLKVAYTDSDVRNFRELITSARVAMNVSDFVEAKKCLALAQNISNTHPEMQNLMAEVNQRYQQMQNLSEATQVWEDATAKARSMIELNPEYPDKEGLFVLLGVKESRQIDFTNRKSVIQLAAGIITGLLMAAMILGLFYLWIAR